LCKDIDYGEQIEKSEEIVRILTAIVKTTSQKRLDEDNLKLKIQNSKLFYSQFACVCGKKIK